MLTMFGLATNMMKNFFGIISGDYEVRSFCFFFGLVFFFLILCCLHLENHNIHVVIFFYLQIYTNMVYLCVFFLSE